MRNWGMAGGPVHKNTDLVVFLIGNLRTIQRHFSTSGDFHVTLIAPD